MQYILLGFLSIIFIWINYKIVSSDIKTKKIPNRLLGYMILLLPFWWTYLFIIPYNTEFTFLLNLDINFFGFLLQIILTLIVSFILYNFGIWSAGDAKYLLVLGLFIPYIGIIPFIGNITILTILYLILYFIWFYFRKCLFNLSFSKSLYINISQDIKDKLLIYLKSGDGNLYKRIIILKLFKWLITFLIVFVSIRISRIYLFKDLFENSEKSDWIINIIQNYNIYILILLIGLFTGLILFFKIAYGKIKYYLVENHNKSGDIIDLFFLSILFIFLIIFLIYEYSIDSSLLIRNLYNIFSIYLGIFLIFLILRYSYKITFNTAESFFIDYKDLKIGDIIDKEYLLKYFSNDHYIKTSGINLKKINQYMDKENFNTIISLYKNFNKYHKKNKTINFSEFRNIKILKTFSFGGYIFLGFLITFFTDKLLFEYIIKFIFYINSLLN